MGPNRHRISSKMTVAELAQIQNRACEIYGDGNCAQCPFNGTANPDTGECIDLYMANDELLNRIEEWNNCLLTRQEIVLQVCPGLNVDEEGVCRIKPCLINDWSAVKCKGYTDCKSCREAYWKQLMIKGEDGKYHEKN